MGQIASSTTAPAAPSSSDLKNWIARIAANEAFDKGLREGGQQVPYNETDFVFTVVAEEWGFTGSMLLLVLYLMAQFVMPLFTWRGRRLLEGAKV